VTRRIFTAREYQDIAVQFMTETPRCNLWAGMGMGKTVSTLTTADALIVSGATSRPILVLGPLRVARDTWPNEVAKWQHLRDLTVVPIVGEKHERLAALKRSAPIYSTNYEQIPWLVEHFKDKWPFETVIADESTRLKSFRVKQGGMRARALGLVARNLTKRWINLTGTPAPNGLADLWGQQWFVDHGERLGNSYSAFMERWFSRNEYTRKISAFKHSEAEIHAKLRDCTLTLDPADYFDLEQPIVNEVVVEMPASARQIYDEFESTMFAELMDGDQLEVFNAAALTNKCLQLANGAAYHGEGFKVIHDAKLDALESIAYGGMPLLVEYTFRSDVERIQKRFPKAVQLGEKAGFKKFMSGDAAMGLAHAKSMGHGIDGLQDVTNLLVRFGHGWNAEERLQMLERIGPVRQAQSGHKRPVQVYDIICKDTLDADVIARHRGKIEIMDALLAAMKRKGYKASTTQTENV
jgi:hypothetical protein